VNYASSAPTRRPEPELPDPDLVESPEPSSSESSEQTLAYLRLLWGKRVLLLRTALCATVASAVVAFLVPPRYESTARLMPPDNQSASGIAATAAALTTGTAGGLSSLAGEYLGLKSTSDVFVGILGSRTVQDKLIQQFDLKKLYWASRMEDARKDLADRTAISVDRKSQIITITVSDKSPQRAAAMAQAYVSELNRLVSDLSTSSARRERVFLEERLQDVSQELEAAEKEFSQFASKNTAIDIKEQGKAMVDAAASLQGQLIAAESQLEGLRQIYADNNVRVRTVKARINELEHQLEKIGGKGEDTSNLPSQPSNSMYPSIRKLPLLGVEYADLYRQTRVQEAVFETLTKEYEMAKVEEAKEIPTVKVLDAADIPDKKSFPPRLLIILFGTALGFAAASVWVIGNQKWQATDPSDPRKEFALEVLSTVKARMSGYSPNGSAENPAQGRAWSWTHRREQKHDDPSNTGNLR
jgi:uncharacterized protein involved in exopolysaccharide biosynthesis